MKVFKLGLVVMAAALISLALSAPAMAFHDDGVAECAGCHTMHNSQGGDVVTLTPGSHLLKMSDPSSTCLSCHAGYGQLTANGSGYGSAGDFYWLTKTYSWAGHHGTSSSEGDSHGHNIIAEDFDLFFPDAVLGTFPPGGSGDVGELACTSCHDPHGTGDGVLLLWGSEKSNFGDDAPVLKGLSRRTVIGESGQVSDTNHVAYGSGASAWCANCHTDMADDTLTTMHPVDRNLGSTISGNYNDYVSTGVMGGDPNTARWEVVPFETNQTQADFDDPLDESNSSTVGPTSASKVMCMTCHRAHATAFPDIGRWDFGATFLVEDSHPLITDVGATADDVANKYYGKTFTADQRSLCNKCHVQD